jgi:hypothetical protein
MTAQRVKIRREGVSENEGQHDQSEAFEHFVLLRGVQALYDVGLIDLRGAVCAAQHTTFTPPNTAR